MKRSHKVTHALAISALGAIAGVVHADDIIFLDHVYPLDVSADGSVVVGNDAFGYETFRWERSSGVVELLGRDTFTPLGIAAGSPDVSEDGTRISASITTDDGIHMTQGLWTLGQGWADLMPPAPIEGGLLDNSFGSAWGISGDGNHVLGFYWRPGQVATGLAHPSIWSAGTGITDLDTSNVTGRANHANYDGSVVVGWTERFDGLWDPTVWEGGQSTVLTADPSLTMANCVNNAGTVIGGTVKQEDFDYREAAIWRKIGGNWEVERIGSLIGTVAPSGSASVFGITDDGSTAVGFNIFNLASTTGFIWTEDDGMKSIEQWVAERGINVPEEIDFIDVSNISSDGSTIIGNSIDTFTGVAKGYIITIESDCQPELNGDGFLDFVDVSFFLDYYTNTDLAIDFNGDGSIDFVDVSLFVSMFGQGCP